MLPLEVRVRAPDLPDATYRFQVAKHRSLSPILVAVAAVNSVAGRAGLAQESTWRWKLSAALRARDGRPARALELGDVESGAQFRFFSTLSDLLEGIVNNAWEPVDLERVDLDLEVSPRLEEVRLVAARLRSPRVRPGGTVLVDAELAAHRGPVATTTLEYRVPETTADGPLTLFVGGGGELARYDAAQAPGRYRAHSVDELLRRLAELPKQSRLYLAAYAAAPQASLRGRDYPELPPSAQIVLSGRQSADASMRWGRASRLGESHRAYDRVVSGGTTLAVQVSRRAAEDGRAAPDERAPRDSGRSEGADVGRPEPHEPPDHSPEEPE
jgi:hypothetical protein